MVIVQMTLYYRQSITTFYVIL